MTLLSSASRSLTSLDGFCCGTRFCKMHPKNNKNRKLEDGTFVPGHVVDWQGNRLGRLGRWLCLGENDHCKANKQQQPNYEGACYTERNERAAANQPTWCTCARARQLLLVLHRHIGPDDVFHIALEDLLEFLWFHQLSALEFWQARNAFPAPHLSRYASCTHHV